MWPKKHNISSKSYQGEIFEGNACRKLLQEADSLNDPKIYKEVGFFRILPFISTFKAMNKLVTNSFSVRKPGEGLDNIIDNIRNSFLSTGVSESLKIHIATRHVKQCLNFLSGDGLGLWSEQAGESIHREFLNTWKRYKINSMEHPQYCEKLTTAVAVFSLKHI